MRPICVPCQRFFRVKTNGVGFTEAMPRNKHAKPGDALNWQPYKLWQGDLWRCESCGAEIISGVGFAPVAERHHDGFEEKRLPGRIRRVRRIRLLMSSPSSACGTCTACCRVFSIPELEKPAGKWCQHCAVGVGCTIYADRPKMCVEWECLWLQSQKRATPLPPELRPDRCKVVFSPTTNETIISAITMPGAPDAHRRKVVKDLIDTIVAKGVRVVVGPPAARRVTMIHRGGEHPIEMTAPDKDGMQWRTD